MLQPVRMIIREGKMTTTRTGGRFSDTVTFTFHMGRQTCQFVQVVRPDQTGGDIVLQERLIYSADGPEVLQWPARTKKQLEDEVPVRRKAMELYHQMVAGEALAHLNKDYTASPLVSPLEDPALGLPKEAVALVKPNEGFANNLLGYVLSNAIEKRNPVKKSRKSGSAQ